MEFVTLGRTGIRACKNGFGALPIQRIDQEAAAGLLRRAFDHGVNFFDTARFYSDSEEKIGFALGAVRDKIFIATKTMAKTPEVFHRELAESLRLLRTSYVDIYQFHNPPFCPRPGDGSGLYEAMLEARDKGLIRFIGFTNHRLKVALEAAESGLYDTVQFPLSYLADEQDLALVRRCRELNVGFVAMKALSGGLITNGRAAYAYLAGLDNVLPIWGIQRREELDEFLSFHTEPPALTETLQAEIDRDRESLKGGFCRGCGYCMPCPVGIQINNVARMSLMLRRLPTANYLSEQWRAEMEKVADCIHCNQCRERCPYGLDTPALLARNLEDYRTYL
ncbi:hypothetical protein SDC9_71985 [bioreactor metagenome]|uniref:4Fe-4S ferredoxin-type domain-containing protein n=1 Tax=bioreactor metagenome TaxID=1076179 RepID=A0A644YAH7_9ZZZZ